MANERPSGDGPAGTSRRFAGRALAARLRLGKPERARRPEAAERVGRGNRPRVGCVPGGANSRPRGGTTGSHGQRGGAPVPRRRTPRNGGSGAAEQSPAPPPPVAGHAVAPSTRLARL